MPSRSPELDLAIRIYAAEGFGNENATRERRTARYAAPDIHCSMNLKLNRGHVVVVPLVPHVASKNHFSKPTDFPDEFLFVLKLT